jgi:hypothetical protein
VNAAHIIAGPGVFAGEADGNKSGIAAGRAPFERNEVFPRVAEVLSINDFSAILIKDPADDLLAGRERIFLAQLVRRCRVIPNRLQQRFTRQAPSGVTRNWNRCEWFQPKMH